ncbi:hypothetical protein [Roseivirga seohaensis]|uniref:hypothetical protein n=1 Tax=Roseivirga seohaensis TaxID=1914963 RepID=UPI003BAA795B
MRSIFSKITFIFLFLSSFNLLSQAPANDDKINAEELILDSIGNFESGLYAYSLVNATADGTVPPNWLYGLGRNVWFKFRPTKPLVNFVLKGDRNKMVALYDSAGNVLQSKTGPYDGYLGMIFEGLDTLQEYYLNIDGRTASSFGIKMSSEIGFDYKSHAEVLELDSAGNFESGLYAYSLVNATADGTVPPNWLYGLGRNVWFKFRPTKPLVNFVLKGDRNKMVALYDSAGNVLQSKTGPYDGYLGMIFEGLDTLQEYYLNIDGRTASSFGIKMSSEIGFDYKSHAEVLELDSAGNFESANNAYSLVGATADGATPPNWYYGVNHNVWFKFKPTVPLVNFVLKGTVNKMAALYDSAGNVLQSKMGPYDGYLGMIFEELDTLQEYYLNIDGRTASSFGIEIKSTFQCINELWAISSGKWGDPNTWSSTEGGQPVSAIPCENTVVYIKGFDVSFNSTETVVAKRLELIGTSSSVMTRLNVQTGELNVVEKIITSGAGVKLQSSTSSTIKVIGAGGG